MHSKPVLIESPVLVLVGPTAIGKTALALELAARFGCEIVSVDSMQVYRYMDIGTAKPTREERDRAPHHLIDVADPDEQYDAARFVREGLAAIERITKKGGVPLLTGGTGLYLKALLHGLFETPGSADQALRLELRERLRQEGRDALFGQLQRVDPESAGRIHPNDTQRLLRALEIYLSSGKTWSECLREQQESRPVRFRRLLQLGLTCERSLLYRRIDERTKLMIKQGLVAEVERLRAMGYGPELPSMQAIGYRHVNNVLDGTWDLDEATRLLQRDTRRYAKRQLTWFGSDPALHWFDREEGGLLLARVETWLKEKSG
ncbi:MAG: tRNA (adenosine(37)-N6)-dimethylallyltransferase MiaA [Desulfobulbaceae bacterium]